MPTSSEALAASLGVRTELAVNAARTSLESAWDCVVVRTPQNPGYYHGNFLFFAQPPAEGDERRWPERFNRAFSADPRVQHAAFCWNGDAGNGAANALVADGYVLDRYLVMTSAHVRDFAVPAGYTMRPMESERDWEQQLTMQLDDVPAAHAGPAYAAFKAAQVDHHREIAGRNGLWFGVFEGDRLAGSCGIFTAGHALARYQDVMVAKGDRNRGVGRALVAGSGRWALETLGALNLVIVADANDFPWRIYQRVGFACVQRESRLWKANRTKRL